MKKPLLFAALVCSSFWSNAQKSSPFASPLAGDKFLKAIETQWPTESNRSALLRQAFNNQYIPDTAFYHGWDDPNQTYFMHTKAHFTYGHGAALKRIDYYEMGNFGWEITTIDTFYYDAANRLTAMETWANGVPEFRMEMNYNANGLLTGRHYMISQGPSRSNTSWETVLGDSIEIHTISNNQITSYTLHAASFMWNGWMPMFKASNIQYNAQGIPVNMALNGYTGTGWSDTILYTNVSWGFGFGNWSEASNMTNAIEERYTIIPQQRHFLKQPTAYVVKQRVNVSLIDVERAMETVAGSWINQVNYERNTATGWEPIGRESYTFANGQLTSVTYEEHDGTGFLPTERYVYAYNTQHLTEERIELWSTATNGWVIDEGFLHRVNMVQSRPDSVETKVYDPMNNVYTAGQLTTYTYSTAASLKPVNCGLRMQVWPNPVADHVQIQITDGLAAQGAAIKVSDLQGRLVYETKVGSEIISGVALSTSNWPSGTYVLQVVVANKSERFRLIKP